MRWHVVLHAGADCYRVVPPLKAKEAAKLMTWGLGPDWQGTNASALISNVVCGIRRGMAVVLTGNQAKVVSYQMVFVTIVHVDVFILICKGACLFAAPCIKIARNEQLPKGKLNKTYTKQHNIFIPRWVNSYSGSRFAAVAS